MCGAYQKDHKPTGVMFNVKHAIFLLPALPVQPMAMTVTSTIDTVFYLPNALHFTIHGRLGRQSCGVCLCAKNNSDAMQRERERETGGSKRGREHTGKLVCSQCFAVLFMPF